MRQVPYRQLRRFTNLQELEITKQAILACTEGERSQFINDNASKCSNLRRALWALGNAKCWYSEASLQDCEGHVEHFRPKKGVAGEDHGGYWWLVFDWTNLRLAHPTVNRRKTDYLTREKRGKGIYFPLKSGTYRANLPGEESQEEPVLLDPVIFSDTLLICFSESGSPLPSYKKEDDEWKWQRAQSSIEYYHLDEGTWNARRQDQMDETSQLCSKIEETEKDTPEYDQALNDLMDLIGHSSEFSSACLQVVRERGLLESITPGRM
ncbi:MAG: hypothetical protein ACYSSI_06645 [Planctomycetota bacterium]|jgi:hypothetical protein